MHLSKHLSIKDHSKLTYRIKLHCKQSGPFVVYLPLVSCTGALRRLDKSRLTAHAPRNPGQNLGGFRTVKNPESCIRGSE